MQTDHHDTIRAVGWDNGALRLLDQRLLPAEEKYLMLQDSAAVAEAIREMVVRGAPAIGISAAYGAVLAAHHRFARAGTDWRDGFESDLDLLQQARPTAVNLRWALQRMRDKAATLSGSPVADLLEEARAIHAEDIRANRRMGELGAALIEAGSAVLTHCNTGSLATGGYGTALGVIRSAWAARRLTHVFADETRPWLQGARLTAWELLRDRIPVTLLVDAAAAHLMREGRVRSVVVGADRIAANGDVANKIGTYSAAVAARHHGLKFMVVAPGSTVDMKVASGDEIPIESRPAAEVLGLAGRAVAAPGVEAWNPAFDITPAELVDVIVTERGVVEAPDSRKMAELMK
ncbi:MAG: S-methyl-5-thioribose-1-phosphate isomerase [Gammaproteobacteria bacterium]|jgi:methylthioribose-1-phosphate isomerase